MKLSELEPQQKPLRLSDLTQTTEQREKLSAEMTHPSQPLPTETRAVRELPEFGGGGILSGEDQGQVAKLTPLFLLSTDPREIGQILTANFPNIKITEDEGGNLIANNVKTGTKSVINKPGFSKLDMLQALGLIGVFSFTGPITGKVGTGLGKLGLKQGITRAGVSGAVAAGGMEAGLQGAQKAAGGEFDVGDVGMASALGGMGEMFGPAVKRFKESRQAKRLATETEALGEVEKNIRRAERATSGKSTQLFPAQKTLDPFALEEQSFVASLPAASRKARNALRVQNKQIAKDVDDFLKSIAPDEATGTASAKIREIAGDSIKAAKVAREEAVSPIFTKAYAEAAKTKLIVNTDDIIKNIDNELDSFGEGPIRNLLLQVKKGVKSATTPDKTGSNLKKLHNEKRNITQKIAQFEQEKGVLDAEIKGKLTNIRQQLVGKLRKESNAYEEAMEEYIRRTPEVKALDQSAIGQISKMKDTQLKSVVSRIFDTTEVNPKVLDNIKKTIQSQDPAAWDAIVRTEAQKRLSKLTLDRAKVTPDNLPAKVLSGLFGEGQKRAVFLRSLNPQQRKNALWLEEVLGRAAQGRPGGSQTGVRNVITEKLRGVKLAFIRFMKNPWERAISTGEDTAFNRSASKMAEALFNPKWEPKLTKIRQSKPSQAKDFAENTAKSVLQLLNDIKEE